MKRFLLLIICAALVSSAAVTAEKPKKDKGEFVEYVNKFWDEIKKSVEDFGKEPEKKNLTFKLDFSGMALPKAASEFKQQWHNEPISQGSTGTCWCFSSTSYLESEIQRLSGKKVKISEMFTVYWEYVEKARRFIRERGNSHFAEGSEGNAVTRIWKQYGCVPEDAYTGLKSGQKFHAHDKLIAEMTAYLNSLKTSNAWNEEEALTTIKAILNFYLGVPPEKVTVDGKTMTPLEYMRNYLKIVPDDYIEFMSMLAYPFYTYAELEVEDNWWKSKDYCNIPIDDFMTIVKNAVKKGYTLAIGGDVSEPGYDFRSQCAIVPTFDIPSEYIDDNARQMRFDNKTTTDDHGVHIVGWLEKDGVMWFLVKDSGSGSRNGTSKGYYFYHEDYIKLKMLSFTIHRSAVEDVLKKMK